MKRTLLILGILFGILLVGTSNTLYTQADDGSLSDDNSLSPKAAETIDDYFWGGQSYHWEPVKSSSSYSLFDDDYMVTDLPFNFTFYGKEFSEIYISSNGFLSFNDSFITSNNPPDQFPTSSYGMVIAPFWSDLNPKADYSPYHFENAIEIQNGSNYWAVTYRDFTYFQFTNDVHIVGTFQAILFDNGSIKFQYLNIYPNYTNSDYLIGLNYGDGVNGSMVMDDIRPCWNVSYIFNYDEAKFDYDYMPTEFKWISAAPDDGIYLQDDESFYMDLSFSFPFYDRWFDRLYISSNGYISLENSNPTDAGGPDSFPYLGYPYVISPFWTDLNPFNSSGGGGVIQTVDYGDRVVITYRDFYHYVLQNESNPRYVGTFQVILYDTGDINFIYQFLNFRPFDYIVGVNKGDGYKGSTVESLDDFTFDEYLENYAIYFQPNYVEDTGSSWTPTSSTTGSDTSSGDDSGDNSESANPLELNAFPLISIIGIAGISVFLSLKRIRRYI